LAEVKTAFMRTKSSKSPLKTAGL